MTDDDVLPRIRWRISVPPGVMIPHGYGIAYYDVWSPNAIAMPLPLNLVVCWWRAVVHWLKVPPGRSVGLHDARVAAAAWERGYAAARLEQDLLSSQRRNPYVAPPMRK